jgi:hypothetical protein
VRFITSPNTD